MSVIVKVFQKPGDTEPYWRGITEGGGTNWSNRQRDAKRFASFTEAKSAWRNILGYEDFKTSRVLFVWLKPNSVQTICEIRDILEAFDEDISTSKPTTSRAWADRTYLALEQIRSRRAMIQLRHASEPVLRLVRRAAALDARARNEASSPAERIVARKECDALCEGQHLDVTRMVVPVPEGIVTSGSSDTILTLEGVPWWRGQLALLSAMHAGFGTPKARPWESDGEDWFLRLVGTNHAVAIARALYATAEAVTVSYARYGPKDRIDEYLCGVVLAIGLVFENTHDLDQKALESASAKAMVVYLERESESERLRPMVPVKPQEGELDLAVTAKDRFHPVRRGFDRAKRNRAGEQVLGERRGTTDPVADLFQRIFGR